jgi:hypothetical protein
MGLVVVISVKVVAYALAAVFGLVALVLLWAAVMALWDAWEDD